MIIRPYNTGDHDEVIGLFFNTVHTVNAADYTDAQLAAWAPDPDSMRTDDELDVKLLNGTTIVAEARGVIIGFGTLTGADVFDLLYIHSAYQRLGAATLIAEEIEQAARLNGAQIITTDASITAKPFFENRGYRVVKKQSVPLRGQTLTNYMMEKPLFLPIE